MISTLNANDMDCTCKHQGCIISDQKYLHGSVIHPIKVKRGIIIVTQGCRFMEIIGRIHRLRRALACTTFDFMFVFWKFCSDLRFSTF